jgi:O-antigen ligase
MTTLTQNKLIGGISAAAPAVSGGHSSINSREGRLAFALFLLLNAVLFIRPAELFTAFEGLPIYNVVMVACILTGLPQLLKQLSWSNFRSNPTVFCVAALLPAIVASQVVHGDFWSAREGGIAFGRVLIYFVLLTGLVRSPSRLAKLIIAMVIYIMAIAAIAELNFHGVIEVKGVSTVNRQTDVDEDDGEQNSVEQLYGPGIFNDPNDFALILFAGVLLLIYFGVTAKGWTCRAVLLLASAVPGYAFALTQSRGGFLALTSGLLVLAVGRFGWKRSIPLLVVAAPLVIVLFGGRMTDINLDEGDTAQGRMMLWREGFALLKGSPLFGTGYATYADEVGQVAHNSFVHAFTELGVLGGTFFCGAFYVPLSVLRKTGCRSDARHFGSLQRLRPILLALLTGYIVGLCSLSRCYTESTYLILGLGAAYCTLVMACCPHDAPVLNGAYMKRLMAVAIGVLLFFNVFVRVF